MENNKIHILIVDDDDRIRDLLKDYLKNNDYIVSTAENAEQAKKRLEYLKFDIIILDVMMPGQNGYELTKEIKKSIKEQFDLLRICDPDRYPAYFEMHGRKYKLRLEYYDEEE